MKRPQRPDLKLTDVKVPQFAADVFYDLRDRRLLPLVALVVVAIVAVPFLLGGGADEVQPPSPAHSGQAPSATNGAQLTVVEGQPGLRDYRKRLRARSRTDPFQQRYTSLPEEAQLRSVDISSGGDAGSSSVESVTEVDASVTDVEEIDNPPGGEGNAGTPSPGGTAPPDDGLEEGRLYGFRPDLRFGVAGSDNLKLYRELPLGRLLPQQNPVLLFVGVTQNGKRALFSVTSEATMVSGDGDCIGGDRNCRLLSMQVGQAVTLTTDQPGRAFRLAIERIEFVALPTPQATERASGSSVGRPDERRTHGVSQSFSK